MQHVLLIERMGHRHHHRIKVAADGMHRNVQVPVEVEVVEAERSR